MKIYTVLFIFFVLFTFTYASKMDSALSSLKNSKVAKTKLGSFIINFAEFTSLMSQADYNPLFDALDEVTAFLLNQKEQEKSLFENNQIIHSTLVSKYTTDKDTAHADVVSLSEEIEANYELKRGFEGEIENQNKNIDDANNGLTKAHDDEIARVQTYQENLADTQSALSAIDEALTLLGTLKSADSAFIQMKTESLKEMKAKIGSALEKVGRKSHFAYKPLFTAIVEILNEQSNYVNQEILEKIIQLLTSLRNSFDEFLQKLEADNKIALDLYTETVNLLTNSLNLALEAKKTAEDNLAAVKVIIGFKEESKAQRETDEKDAQESLDRENTQWEEAVAAFEKVQKEIENELAIVESCISTLNVGGVRRS